MISIVLTVYKLVVCFVNNQKHFNFILLGKTVMIYGYIRVSTDKQTTKNQKYEIEKFCKKEKIKIDRWIMETISATQELNKRKLGNLLQTLSEKDILIASELSRLGRNLFQVMSILNFCLNKGVLIWTIKDNYRLGSDIQSKVLAFAFGLSAEIERNLISQRTKEALNRLRNEGHPLGRPSGRKNNRHILDSHNHKIFLLLKNNTPKSKIAQILNCNRKTLYNYLKHINFNSSDMEPPFDN